MIINAIPVTYIGEPIQRSNTMDGIFMLACDYFDNFSDTYTTTRVYMKTPKSVIVHGRKCGRRMLLTTK